MATNRSVVTIYTDGSCLNNGQEDSRGGWAAIITFKDKEKVLIGNCAGTKNNRMELTAAIEGIRALTRPCEITVVTDSQYVCRCFEGLKDWYTCGWKTKGGNKPANLDLLQDLLNVGKNGHHKFHAQYIEGHRGHPYNERCDTLAKSAAMTVQVNTGAMDG